MKKISVEYFMLLISIFCLSGCELLGEEQLEKEQSCDAALMGKPVVKEKEDYLSREEGEDVLLVEMNEDVDMLYVKSELQANSADFQDSAYVSHFDQALDTNLETESLTEDPDNPGYWMVDIQFPATNIATKYQVQYGCRGVSSENLSEVAEIEINAPDFCTIKEQWRLEPQSIVAGSSGNLYRDHTTLDKLAIIFRPYPEDHYIMSHIPYELISSTAYVTAGSYSYTYENFIDDLLTQSGQSKPKYFHTIVLEDIDLHALTGISAQQWSTWSNGQVTIEAEIKVCGENYSPWGPSEESRFLIAWWNP